MIRRSRRINSTLGRITRAAARFGRSFGKIWRRSLQLRVVVSTLLLSFVVLLVLSALQLRGIGKRVHYG